MQAFAVLPWLDAVVVANIEKIENIRKMALLQNI